MTDPKLIDPKVNGADVIALGSGRATALGVAPKAAMLDRAAAAGLPVPTGWVIAHGRPPAAPPAGTFAVRSAFGAEDGLDRSLAGWFDSELRVTAADVPAAVERVRASASRHAGSFRTDVLVMAMVEAVSSGVAFCEPGTYDDIVNVTTGTAEDLVAGVVAGDRQLLPRLESAPEGWPRRLQRLLREVRQAFGDEPWDIEWADDARRCWLVQVRPITARPRRDEILTLANHAEILPELPSTLMTSVVAEAGPDLFDWYRRHDRSLPSDRDFLQVKAGRPLINLSLLEDMMRHLGLPTGLVADSIGGDTVERRPPNPRRLIVKLPTLVRLGLAQIVASVRGRGNRERILAVATEPMPTFAAAVDHLHRAYVLLVTGMFPLSSAIGPPLAILRRLGVLVEHASRHRTITAELADAISELGDGASDRNRADFLDRFGHRGVYESDIARPRYRDDPSTLAPTGLDVGGRSAPPLRTVMGRLTTPLWWAARGPLAAREQWRHDAMMAFDLIRRELVRLAASAVEAGVLPDVDSLWLLDVDEARRLDEGWIPDSRFWAERRALRAELAAIEMPMTLTSGDDPRRAPAREDTAAGLQGLPLTSGVVSGVAWVLDEPAAPDTAPIDDGDVVLVARSIDAGWITTLTRCAAVVVEIGGDLSHGSILVRELGIPAVTNVGGARRAFSSGSPIVVDASSGTVTAGPSPL